MIRFVQTAREEACDLMVIRKSELLVPERRVFLGSYDCISSHSGEEICEQKQGCGQVAKELGQYAGFLGLLSEFTLESH